MYENPLFFLGHSFLHVLESSSKLKLRQNIERKKVWDEKMSVEKTD